MMKRLAISSLLITIFVFGSIAQCKEKGYRAFFDANYVVGINGWNKQLPALQTSHGYQFNSWLYAGAGLTLDWVTNSSRHDTSSANLFLDLRSDLLRKKSEPVCRC